MIGGSASEGLDRAGGINKREIRRQRNEVFGYLEIDPRNEGGAE